MKNDYTDLNDQYSAKDSGYYGMQRPEMLQFIPSDAKSVLEVGCSSGAFGALLKESRQGVEVWGIEPNDAAATMAAERLDHAICGTFEADMSELAGKKFDCIVFNDVLEHTIDPASFLDRSREYLSENGVVVASIPNFLYFPNIIKIVVSEDWQYTKSGILDSTHLRFFTRKSMIRLFEEAGFQILDIAGIKSSATKPYRILNLLTLNHMADWRYLQFAITAAPR